MNQVRRKLRTVEDDQLVTQVLLDCGVSELGRFAGTYRALFGESPVQSANRYKLQRSASKHLT